MKREIENQSRLRHPLIIFIQEVDPSAWHSTRALARPFCSPLHVNLHSLA